MRMNKKGQVFENLGKLGIGVAALTIILVITFLILSEGASQVETIDGVDCNTTNSASLACNATNELTGAVDDIPGWVPIVIITSIGAILIGLVRIFKR